MHDLTLTVLHVSRFVGTAGFLIHLYEINTQTIKEISRLILTKHYLLTPWSSISWEAKGFSASEEIPRIYGTRRFITAFTTARHLSLSWGRSIQPIPRIPLPEDPS